LASSITENAKKSNRKEESLANASKMFPCWKKLGPAAASRKVRQKGLLWRWSDHHM